MLFAALAILSASQAISMRTVWFKTVPSTGDSCIALTDSKVYALGRSGTALAIDIVTGRTLATRYLGKLTPAIGTSNTEGVFAVVDSQLCRLRNTDLTIEWRSPGKIDFPEIGVAVTPGPDGTVAVKRLRGVSFFSATDGKSVGKQWAAGFGSPASSPLYTEGGVLFMSGAMALVDHKKDKAIWTAKVGQATMSETPHIERDSIYAVTKEGLSKVDLATGTIRWNVKGCGSVSPVVGEVVVTNGGGLSGYSTTDGKKLWTVPQLATLSNALKVGSDMVAVMYYRGRSVRVGVFSAIDGELLQESGHLAQYSLTGVSRLFLSKQGTIIGNYRTTAFCLASGS
ncbi:MAG: hypothetical protein BGO01_00925 [Armatimonadetes bacterium 55-13]|nr:PQQ-binding-like beta-propeller repeat protein [Armatimonadota bacterium]OJU62367.1 MAG: hypothetical protein BGO01_00925 [Armatimonadetes bacterium 55-13]